VKESVRRTVGVPCPTAVHGVCRRLALRSSGLAVLGLVSRSAFGQTSSAEPSTHGQARPEQSQAFAERMQSAASMEERQQIMNEQIAWHRQQAVEGVKGQLGLSEKEWSVVKPRLQTVYDLVHPNPPMPGRNEPAKGEVEQISRALRELLRDQAAPPDQIKAGLVALRAARERRAQELTKARQNLRQLMTLRQEAVLVLNGLLD
jgi:hypothetical protein